MSSILRRLTYKQLLGWMLYEQLEPFGERRGDYQAAMVARTIAEVHRDGNKKPEAYKIDDFLLRFEEREQKATRLSPIEQSRRMRQIYAAYSMAAKDL